MTWLNKRNGTGTQISNMITSLKRIVVPLCITSFLAIVGIGRNTARGFDKYVSNAGQGIQNGAR
jgi:predicted small secreted protein